MPPKDAVASQHGLFEPATRKDKISKNNKEDMKMADQVCPECGCDIEDAFDMGGILYCCETCATNSECEYGYYIDEPLQAG